MSLCAFRVLRGQGSFPPAAAAFVDGRHDAPYPSPWRQIGGRAGVEGPSRLDCPRGCGLPQAPRRETIEEGRRHPGSAVGVSGEGAFLQLPARSKAITNNVTSMMGTTSFRDPFLFI